MKPLPPHPDLLVRSVGFDDGPFLRGRRGLVPVCGVVCAGTRFEGMVWGRVRQDGWNATDVLSGLLVDGKFLKQLHAILLDGVTFAGFNVVDLGALSARTGKPVVAVMRHAPDLAAIASVARALPRSDRRLELLARAGPIHHVAPFTFQCHGVEPDTAAEILRRTTDRGYVPEPLRLAHLVAGAVKNGQSGRRA